MAHEMKSTRKRIRLSDLPRSPCERLGTPDVIHAGYDIEEVECPACGAHFTECEECLDSDKRCVPCIARAIDPTKM